MTTKPTTEEEKTIGEIIQIFDKRRKKVEILWQALDIMQGYNGRTRWECVGLAMGYKIKEK